jgi:hypothetical protein
LSSVQSEFVLCITYCESAKHTLGIYREFEALGALGDYFNTFSLLSERVTPQDNQNLKTAIINHRFFRVLFFRRSLKSAEFKKMRLGTDPSSFSQPDFVQMKHVDLDWTVNFNESVLVGTATIRFFIVAKFIEEIVSHGPVDRVM